MAPQIAGRAERTRAQGLISIRPVLEDLDGVCRLAGTAAERILLGSKYQVISVELFQRNTGPGGIQAGENKRLTMNLIEAFFRLLPVRRKQEMFRPRDGP